MRYGEKKETSNRLSFGQIPRQRRYAEQQLEDLFIRPVWFSSQWSQAQRKAKEIVLGREVLCFGLGIDFPRLALPAHGNYIYGFISAYRQGTGCQISPL